jgi:hypothetical protein
MRAGIERRYGQITGTLTPTPPPPKYRSPRLANDERRDRRSMMERWTSRIRRLTLDEAIGFLPFTTGVAASLSIGLVTYKLRRQPDFPYFIVVLGWAIPVVVLALVLAIRFGRRPPVLPTWISTEGSTSWMIALQLGVLLLVIPVLLLTKAVAADHMAWLNYPFLNKRWLIALYNLAIATFLVFPVAFERWRSPCDGDRQASVIAPQQRNPGTRQTVSIGGLVVIVLLAWYFAGPPWHLERHHRRIDLHEQVHLGPLQAISKGYLPYVGPASTQYGPGSQILLYGLMKMVGHFDIVSFRTAWASLNFVALLAVSIAAYFWLGLVAAVLVILFSLVYSPFAFFYTAANGTFAGFYGWANALRYFAPLIVVPALAGAAASESSERPSRVPWVVLLGVVWGLGAWIAQENLSTTAMASALFLTLLWLTQTMSLSRAIWIVFRLVIGFACVAVPVTLYFAWHGAAGVFLRNYLLVPRAIAMGYQNTWWTTYWPPEVSAGLDQRSYYFTLPFLLALGISALWALPALRLKAPLDLRRARFLAFICVGLACFQTALLRSDNAHLLNTMLALPFVLVLGVSELPQWQAVTRVHRTVIRVVFVILALVVYHGVGLEHWDMLVTPLARFRPARPVHVSSESESRIAFRRATTLLTDEPIDSVGRGLSMRTFLDFATEIHEAVGQRKTYIANLGYVWSGLLYFMADLTPAPYPLDRESMMINEDLRGVVVNHIRAHPEDYECFIGISLSEPEAQAFLESHPGAVTLQRRMGSDVVNIVLSQGQH